MSAARPPLEIDVERLATLVIVGAMLTLAAVSRNRAIGAGGLVIAAPGLTQTDYRTVSAWWISMILGSAVAYPLFAHLIPAQAPASKTVVGMLLVAACLSKAALTGMGRARNVWSFTRAEDGRRPSSDR
jgi:hypothetical protein